jgi:molybdopterin adenylyltransferase
MATVRIAVIVALAVYNRGVSQQQHKHAAPAHVTCFVLTVSDTRTETTDTSGGAIAELLQAAGHHVAGRAIVKDEPADVTRVVSDQLAKPDVQVIITTGGTGVTSRDRTYEAIVGLIEKRLEGFGELFRMLSYQEIGPAAMLSRAVAGTVRGKVIASLPGSEAAVRLAMTKLLLPELGHLVQQVSK